ncbi:CD248 molecule, endosialin a [Chelmon rostratus]|uniref:CD248 molecule, endosialin a n=1 Tax=Chelmon rostratus TaxID=109905 RepID=UPI001BE5A215|nr:CD248 molecule, endosialin a [Chelmon rostratus]
MGFLVSSAALLLTSLLALLFGVSSVFSQDLRERDALCNSDGCFVVYFQRKTFLDSWRACKEKGGNLATIKRKDDATVIANLFSTIDLRHSRTEVRVWIGLQRQPRQCTTTRPLRGFSWTTGDQDTEYTNWQKEDSPHMCSVPRCVVMGYSTQEQDDNFKWLDGSCSVSVDGYLCHYAYKGMCTALWSEGAGNALYTTPFNLLSTLLTHVPFGSVATVPCPADTKEEQSVLCMLKEDGSVGWSRDSPLCSNPPVSHSSCDKNNGGCEHFCRPAGVHFYCECVDGYQLADNGQNCELSDVCQGASCEFECLPLSDGYRCACPEGYMLAPDERGCLDVDECLQSPCEHICVNAPGTFECQCREGYNQDDEVGCEDIDECINDPCEHACENTPGSHICHCHLGFSPVPEDPSRCQDTDECQIPGTCEQMCVNYEGGFECYCEEGYELMSDHYSCHKRGDGNDQSAVTPPFPWVTHQPGPVWDPVDYWNPQQSHTDWPMEEDQSLDWLTDPPRVLDSDVIWVTSAPQEDLPIDLALDSPTEEAEEEEDNIGNGEADWLEWGLGSQSELGVLPITSYTTPPPATDPSTTTEWYGDDDEETTTALPFLSTSTISEGAWNWWPGLTTSSQKPGNPEDSVIDHNMPTDSSYHNVGEEQYPLRENSNFPGEEFREQEKGYVEITHSQDSVVPTHLIPSQPPPSVGGILDSVEEDREKNSTWLLVGLLVPICIFIVVMVALGIVYCTRCAVQPRNKNATDCYHWISGAHDKQGVPNPSAGVKTHV